jgi:hypothetical protein
MERNEKIVVYAFCTYFVFGLVQFIISKNFIAPFPLNGFVLSLVAFLFVFDKNNSGHNNVKYFFYATLCFLVSDSVFLSVIFSNERTAYLLKNSVLDWLRLLGYILFTFLLVYFALTEKRKTTFQKIARGLLLLGALFFILTWSSTLSIDRAFPSVFLAIVFGFILRTSTDTFSYGSKSVALLFMLMGGLDLFRLMSFAFNA